MIALLGALKEETATLRRRMAIETTHCTSTCRIAAGTHRGREIILATTGMGRQRAEAAAKLVLDRYPITALISFGYAGALTDELVIGDVVLGSPWSAMQGNGQDVAKLEPLVLDENTLALAVRALENVSGITARVAGGVTVPSLICEPKERTAVGKAFDAQIVDMESYWIAKVASERGIPFVAIRAISDTRREKLLPFTQMMTVDGRWKWKETARYFVRRPQGLMTLLRMAARIQRARRNLAASVDCLVDGFGREGGMA